MRGFGCGRGTQSSREFVCCASYTQLPACRRGDFHRRSTTMRGTSLRGRQGVSGGRGPSDVKGVRRRWGRFRRIRQSEASNEASRVGRWTTGLWADLEIREWDGDRICSLMSQRRAIWEGGEEARARPTSTLKGGSTHRRLFLFLMDNSHCGDRVSTLVRLSS